MQTEVHKPAGRAKPRARKRPPAKVHANLSIRAEVMARAKEMGLNLSEVFERALENAIREGERIAWVIMNREAVDEYNAQVAKRGVFSDDHRRF
jgi:antitoxin CcdA